MYASMFYMSLLGTHESSGSLETQVTYTYDIAMHIQMLLSQSVDTQICRQPIRWQPTRHDDEGKLFDNKRPRPTIWLTKIVTIPTRWQLFSFSFFSSKFFLLEFTDHFVNEMVIGQIIVVNEIVMICQQIGYSSYVCQRLGITLI